MPKNLFYLGHILCKGGGKSAFEMRGGEFPVRREKSDYVKEKSMAKRKKYLFTAIVWAIVAGMWILAICLDFYFGETSKFLIVLRGVCVLVTCAAAIISFMRYTQRDKHEDK